MKQSSNKRTYTLKGILERQTANTQEIKHSDSGEEKFLPTSLLDLPEDLLSLPTPKLESPKNSLTN